MSRLRISTCLYRYLRPSHGRFLPLHAPIAFGLSTDDRGICADPAGAQYDWRSSITLTSTSFCSFATSTANDQTATPGKRTSDAMAVLKVKQALLVTGTCGSGTLVIRQNWLAACKAG